jgi:hypothetical protein
VTFTKQTITVILQITINKEGETHVRQLKRRAHQATAITDNQIVELTNGMIHGRDQDNTINEAWEE